MTEPKKEKKRNVIFAVPKRLVWAFVIMTTIMFLVLCGFAWVVTDIQGLGTQNKSRISEIQKSRIESCKGIYQGIHEVFLPFFPTKPSDKEQTDLDKFNKTIDRLTKKCEKQTKAKVNK